jgi:hypothetical protein
LETFRQVADFLDKNGAKIGALATSPDRKVLDDVVAQLEAHRLDQDSWTLEMTGKASRRTVLEKELRKEHMQPISKYARARLRGLADQAEYATLAGGTSDFEGDRLVAAARAMAKAAAPYLDGLKEATFAPDVLDRLSAKADELQESIEARRKLRTGRAGATKGMKEQATRGLHAVRMLDAVIEAQFAKDEVFLASWRSAKRVPAKPGVPRGKSVTPQEQASGGSPVAA